MKGLKQTIKINKFEYDNGKSGKIFTFPRGRKAKLDLLKTFVKKECEKTWRTEPKCVATLKREALNQLIDDIALSYS